MIRTYSEMMQYPTFEERFRYLKLDGVVANETFGFDRYLNQQFYKSAEWKRVRQQIIIRDQGCDLACQDRPIFGQVIVHDTHNAIHYGDVSYEDRNKIVERKPGDTRLW